MSSLHDAKARKAAQAREAKEALQNDAAFVTSAAPEDTRWRDDKEGRKPKKVETATGPKTNCRLRKNERKALAKQMRVFKVRTARVAGGRGASRSVGQH